MITAEIWFALQSQVDDTVGTLILTATGDGTKNVLSQALRFFIEFEPSIEAGQITIRDLDGDGLLLEDVEMWEWVRE